MSDKLRKRNVKEIKENVQSSLENVSSKIKEKAQEATHKIEERAQEIISSTDIKRLNWPAFIYGILCYSIFTWTFIHLVLWLSNSSLLNRTIDYDFTTKTTTATFGTNWLFSFFNTFPFVSTWFNYGYKIFKNLPFINWFTNSEFFNYWIFKLPVVSFAFKPFYTTATVTIPSILTENLWTKLLIDTSLFGLFVFHHVLMLNRTIQRNLLKFNIPEPIIQVTNILIASSLLSFLFAHWRPLTTVTPIVQSEMAASVPGTSTTFTITPQKFNYPIGAQYVNTVWVWPSNNFLLREFLNYTFYIGVLMTSFAAFIWDQFDLLGMNRFWKYCNGMPYESTEFNIRGVYRYMSHPITIGMLLFFWSAPIMSYSRFFFCCMATLFIAYGVGIETVELGKKFGPKYEEYIKTTGYIPFYKYLTTRAGVPGVPVAGEQRRPVVIQEREEVATTKKQQIPQREENIPGYTASA